MNPLHVIIGSGPLGRAIAAELSLRGHRARLVSRTARDPGLPGIEALALDVTKGTEAIAACDGAAVVYQCAAPAYQNWAEEFPELQENILRGAARAGAVLVAAENLYGYGVAGTLHEGLPLSATTRKGATRARMTGRLFEAHAKGEARTVAGRASDFFGPGVRASALGERLWPALLKGRNLDWFGDADAPRSFTYVPDFARALILLGQRDEAWGRAWHVPSPPPRTPRAVIMEAAALAGITPPRIRRTPKLVLRGAGLFIPAAGEMVEMAYSYDAPFVMSDDAFTAAFGGEATGWDEALRATITWWRAQSAQ